MYTEHTYTYICMVLVNPNNINHGGTHSGTCLELHTVVNAPAKEAYMCVCVRVCVCDVCSCGSQSAGVFPFECTVTSCLESIHYSPPWRLISAADQPNNLFVCRVPNKRSGWRSPPIVTIVIIGGWWQLVNYQSLAQQDRKPSTQIANSFLRRSPGGCPLGFIPVARSPRCESIKLWASQALPACAHRKHCLEANFFLVGTVLPREHDTSDVQLNTSAFCMLVLIFGEACEAGNCNKCRRGVRVYLLLTDHIINILYVIQDGCKSQLDLGSELWSAGQPCKRSWPDVRIQQYIHTGTHTCTTPHTPHTCTHTDTDTETYTYAHSRTRAHSYAWTGTSNAGTHLGEHRHTCIQTYTYTLKCTHAQTHKPTYTHTHTHSHTHTHTHTHTHDNFHLVGQTARPSSLQRAHSAVQLLEHCHRPQDSTPPGADVCVFMCGLWVCAFVHLCVWCVTCGALRAKRRHKKTLLLQQGLQDAKHDFT
jgi:hypothetical protein